MLLASEIEQIGALCSHLSNPAKHATAMLHISIMSMYEYTLTIFNFLFIRNRGYQGSKI